MDACSSTSYYWYQTQSYGNVVDVVWQKNSNTDKESYTCYVKFLPLNLLFDSAAFFEASLAVGMKCNEVAVCSVHSSCM